MDYPPRNPGEAGDPGQAQPDSGQGGMNPATLQALLAASARSSAFGPVGGQLPHPPPFPTEPGPGQQLGPSSMHLFNQLLGQPGLAHLAGYPDSGPPSGPGPAPGNAPPSPTSGGDGGGGKKQRTRAGPSPSSSSYASRHQQAEARRRSRINDRLEALREVVPHSERANTATFLEDVLKYVRAMQRRMAELEAQQPHAWPPGMQAAAAQQQQRGMGHMEQDPGAMFGAQAGQPAAQLAQAQAAHAAFAAHAQAQQAAASGLAGSNEEEERAKQAQEVGAQAPL
ncbi:Transcription factor BIM2 [Auxenochlorella protothecoides]|uniref:Transcription factor BIM2 n=1 Tax=Auxenochlorella protothecoides TaxID=3075 RepID=A0A087SPE4_AUXPR|nr:Transcription factor BIM2 [Auxenochlorella protothecoides]KFM27598.1 Transcription factor BIM2 [Auxenochlorella protothecoides]